MTEEFDVNEKKIQDQNTASIDNKTKPDKGDFDDDLLNSLEEVIGDSENNAGEAPDSSIKADPEAKAKAKADPESEDALDDLEGLVISGNELDDKDVIEKDDLKKEVMSELSLTTDKAQIDSDGLPEPESGDVVDDLDISGNGLDDKDVIEKDDLENDKSSDDIFLEDRATIDKDIMPKESLTTDEAQIDIDLPGPEKKKEKKKSSLDEVKQDESLQTPLQNIIARIKQFSPVKIRIVISAVIAVLLFCMGVLFFILFFGGEQEENEEIFADSVPAYEIKESVTASLSEDYEMKTFVIPMQDSARERVFFKADFIIKINKVDLIQLKNNNVKIRNSVYNLFYNKNSEIILKKLKRSEQLYKLKNVLNLIFKKEIIKDIEMVNYKVV